MDQNHPSTVVILVMAVMFVAMVLLLSQCAQAVVNMWQRSWQY
jgi:hypothetical protein